MIPILYEDIATKPNKDRVCALPDCISCVVTEIRNGEYDCQFTYPVNGTGYNEIMLGRHIGCTHDANGDVQPFTIYRKEANLDGTVTYYAHHITYELNYVVQYPFSVDGVADLFDYFNEHQTTATGRYGGFHDISPYVFATDLTNAATYTLASPAAFRSMLGGDQNSVLKMYGGEFKWDWYNVSLLTQRGRNNGAVIRYGGNLTSASNTDDDSNAYGAVVPYWTDRSTGTVYSYGPSRHDDDDLSTFPWKAVPLDLSNNFNTWPDSGQADQAAQAYLDSNVTWLPFNNLTVDFVPWTDGQINAESERLQNVCLCDFVLVKIPRLGVSVLSKVTKTVWNALLDRYDSIELGDLNPSYASVITAGRVNAGVDASGIAAHGIPPGGTTGQLLVKASNTDYDAGWASTLPELILNAIYPVGSLYLSTSSTNPSGFLGGTWEAYAKGRTLIGAGTGSDGDTIMNFDEGDQGGEYKHTLTTNEIPSHSHTYNRELSTGSTSGIASARYSGNRSSFNTGSTGGGAAHNNMQPYIAVYIWRRTA